jgi:hypothetical protein
MISWIHGIPLLAFPIQRFQVGAVKVSAVFFLTKFGSSLE